MCSTREFNLGFQAVRQIVAEGAPASYLDRMARGIDEARMKPRGGFSVLLRFLPMLWPKGERQLKTRVVVALLLVLLGKAAVLVMPFAYKAVIDRMSGSTAAFGVVA